MRFRRHPWLVVLLLALTPAPVVARQPLAPRCPGGRFAVQGAVPLGGAAGEAISTIMIDGRDVAIEGRCDPVTGRVRRTRRGTVVKARWRACSGVEGAVRFRGLIDPTSCTSLSGMLGERRARVQRHFVAVRESTQECQSRAPAGGAVCPGKDTFEIIQHDIFIKRSCTLAGCHGATRAGNLDLQDGAAHANLVGVLADNPVARTAGKLRVRPGDAAASFLAQKLHGTLLSGEGSPMPLVGLSIPAIERELIEAWIDACAPATGKVPGAPCLPPETYVPTPPLAPPPDGYQMVLEGPTLQPGEEQEGCLWVPAPNATDAAIKKVEVALNPGIHHFAVWRHNGQGTPPLGVWLGGDIACLSGSTFGQAVAGSPQAPYFVTENPPGIASILPGGGYYGLNAHYYNEFDVPIQIRVWTNFYPYAEGEAPPAHYSRAIIALDTTFNINVPPFTQRTLRGRYRNDSNGTRHVLGVGGHMHKRGLRFSIWQSDGTKVLDDLDWSHPTYKGYWPPYEMKPGDWFDYECLHDNGVTRPVRLDASGNPKTITFGLSAEDEMCIMTGSFYDD